jgi:subtilase family serine protease
VLPFCFWCYGQKPGQPNRVTNEINASEFVPLAGNVRPLAQPQFDRGAVEDEFVLPYITLTLKQSSAQQAALRKLLSEQQTKSSRNYHKWLTPEQYADRFGAAPEDLAKIALWLQGNGFTILGTARGRDWIAFRGNAAQIRQAFHSEIHRFDINGQTHFANQAEPSIPLALRDLVLGVRGLDNFGLRPSYTQITTDNNGNPVANHYLAPADIAAVYNFNPLYAAGIDGSGVKLAVVGQSDVTLTDLQQFRAGFGLPANDPQIVLVPGSPDPGHTADEAEAALDLEWAGAVAPGASVLYVNAAASAGGVFGAAQYVIDNNLAQVIDMAYGSCEQSLGASAISSFELELQKANSEGITLLAATGDMGAAACEPPGTIQIPTLAANQGPAVNYPASSPEATAVGGTTLKEGSLISWSVANAANGGSALSNIPEGAWNDTNGTLGLAATGGGPSACATGAGNTCAGFPKPSWQNLNITGIPADGVRDIPDIALAASPNHDGYIACVFGSCANNFPGTVIAPSGGTSAATSVAAAMVTLLNEYVVAQGIQSAPGLGNINPNLYQLVQVANTSTIYHDVTSGNNVVPCNPTSTGCPVVAPFQYGFTAGPGYDLVTGLGSIDANDFFTNWGWITGNAHLTTITTVSATAGQGTTQQITPGSAVTFTVTVNALSGLPTGNINLVSGSTTVASAPLINGTAVVTLTPAQGEYSITANYAGDGTFLPSTSAPLSFFAADFSISTNTTSFALNRGGSISIPITITPTLPNYNPTVTLSCYGLPSEATCTFTPAEIAPVGGPAVATLVVATTAPNSALRVGHSPLLTALCALLFPGFGLLWIGGSRRATSARTRLGVLLLALGCSTLWWTACSGGSRMPPDPGSFPTGSIPFSVTANTGGTSPIFHTMTLTMNLQ